MKFDWNIVKYERTLDTIFRDIVNNLCHTLIGNFQLNSKNYWIQSAINPSH